MFRSPTQTHPETLAVSARSSASPLALSALTVGTAVALNWLGDGPQFAAEGLYLALLATAPLAATLILAEEHWARFVPAAALPSAALPLLLLLALAALPGGPLRGAAVGLLLALALAVSAVVTLSLRPSLARWCLFALGSGALLQARRFLAPELDVALWMNLVALPLLGGVAAAVIARRHGPPVALAMVTLGLLGAGSWSPTLVGGLLASAAVLEWVAGPAAQPPRVAPVPLLVGLVALPPLWQVETGVAITVGALAPLLGRFWPALLLVAGALLALLGEPSSWRAVLPLAGMIVALWPILWLVPPGALRVHGRWRGLGSALAVLAITARTLPTDRAVTLACLVLFAAALKPDADAPAAAAPAPREGRRSVLLAITLVLLTMTLARAAYPWLRQESPLAALARAGRPVPALVTGRQISWPPATLRRESPRWEGRVSAAKPGLGLLVDSALANGAQLEVGTVVARVVVEATSPSGGPTRHEWPLRAGLETGEWAAARQDLRALPSPPPWLSWVDASGEFFGQRYRARFETTRRTRTETEGDRSGEGRLTITLEPGLPEDCQLTLYSVSTTSR